MYYSKEWAFERIGKGLTWECADDPNYFAMNDMIVPGAQAVTMINAAKIMKDIHPLIDPLMNGSSGSITSADIEQVFGAKAGIVTSQKFDGKTVEQRSFLPLDYEKLIHIVSAAFASSTPARGLAAGAALGRPGL